MGYSNLNKALQDAIIKLDGELKTERNLRKSVKMHLENLRPSLSFHTETARYEFEEIIKIISNDL